MNYPICWQFYQKNRDISWQFLNDIIAIILYRSTKIRIKYSTT